MSKNPRKQISEAKDALHEIMRENIAEIADGMVVQIMGRLRNATPAQRLDAIKNLDCRGAASYKSTLLTGLSLIALETLRTVKLEVPAASHIKLSESDDDMMLSEFDRLPPNIKRRVKSKSDLLVDTQIADLEKTIAFQFTSSVESTDSDLTIEEDLKTAAQDYIEGNSVAAGAALSAAETVNQTRKEWFEQPEVQDELDAFQFLNGDPVSPICQDLAGTTFSKDDAGADRYYPPLHFNCKSYVIPILKGNLGSRDITPLKPSQSSLDDYVQLSEDGRSRCSCGCC